MQGSSILHPQLGRHVAWFFAALGLKMDESLVRIEIYGRAEFQRPGLAST